MHPPSSVRAALKQGVFQRTPLPRAPVHRHHGRRVCGVVFHRAGHVPALAGHDTQRVFPLHWSPVSRAGPTLDATRTDSGAPSSDPGATRASPSLVLVHHPDPRHIGARVTLAPGQSLTLGRRGDALGPGVLDDDRLSRRQCTLTGQGEQLLLRDLGSRNGTTCNGLRVEQTRLASGDVLGAGRLLWVVEQADPPAIPPEGPLIGLSLARARLLERLQRIAPLGANVLITGETGVGKELAARALHDLSGRGGPFVAVNCGAVDDGVANSELLGHARGAFTGAAAERTGLIPQAHGGTLFLDEIGEASPALMTRLLRVLEDGEVRPVGANRARTVDVRFVAATHRDLEGAIADGSFRADLFARLAQWQVPIPPLRARRADILPIARHLAARAAGQPVGLHHRLARWLLLGRWPLNVRGLDAAMRELVLLSDGVDVGLPDAPSAALEAARGSPRPADPAPDARPDAATLRAALTAANGNVKACAAHLGIGRTTLYRWLREHGIDPRSARGAGDNRAD
ncbi:MAG: sigma 54-dependent Fis family transcriptional regulator [Alphaproteobacteria bacterium]|nr:sigma 54-dependent Fis family transcriptional regulator [Alphaproteobacteria bacterium]